MYYAVGTMIIVYDYNRVKKKENRTVYSQTSSLQSDKYCLQLDIWGDWQNPIAYTTWLITLQVLT